MELLQKTMEAMKTKKEIVLVDAQKEIVLDDVPKQKKDKRPIVRRASPKPTKMIVPEHIKVLFNNLDKSISSVWGVQANGKIKWDAKYSMWCVFKEYFKELM